MSRPIRIVYKDAYYQETNRGSGRQAILIEEEAYLSALSRYIHRNPIETKRPLVKKLGKFRGRVIPHISVKPKRRSGCIMKHLLECSVSAKNTYN